MIRLRKEMTGFTLIELIIVILVIGVLAAIILPKFTGQVDQAKIATVKANIESLRSATRLYYSDNQGAWPGYTATMTDLVTDFIKAVPEEAVTGVTTVTSGSTVSGVGGWLYDATSGDWAVNLTGNDRNADAYSGY